MAYQRVIYDYGHVIEVGDYHSSQYGAPGEGRKKKKKPTPEQVARQNQWQKERKARHKLLKYMAKNDYFVTLTYRRDARPPDMKTAKEHFKAFRRKVAAAFKKQKAIMRWLRNIEVGTKNGWHVHLIINRIPDLDIILREAWPHGKVVCQLLYDKGGFWDLAAYITKTPKTDPRLKDASYSASRNMPLPPPKKYTYLHWKTWDKENLRVRKGYYVDKVFESVNQVTGYPFRWYTAFKIPEKGGKPR